MSSFVAGNSKPSSKFAILDEVSRLVALFVGGSPVISPTLSAFAVTPDCVLSV
jgi:hypothetical protein